MKKSTPANTRIATIGLGYVGLPLSVAFAKKFPVVGFDINEERVRQLKNGRDVTLEVSDTEMKEVLREEPGKGTTGLWVTSSPSDIAASNFYIVTVPTPTDSNNRPVLTPLIKASETVGRVLKEGDYVVYESTVFPGATEEVCIPILEAVSGLKFNVQFFVGYSPERINPGDKEHTVTNILKVTSGSTPEAALYIDQVYKEIITAGTYRASSIKVAEAAKVIENSQRDINIAFVNELAKIFNRLGIDTREVLDAAGTKWNFLPFRPGLVGGHCIGVDPFYLAQKAQEVGYHPEIILAGRRLNDSMGQYVATQLIKLMHKKGITSKNSRVLMLGLTFKENCPDIRNSGAIHIYQELVSWDVQVDVFDPWADTEEVRQIYGLELHEPNAHQDKYDGIILAVAHDYFSSMMLDDYKKEETVVYDVKGFLPREWVDERL